MPLQYMSDFDVRQSDVFHFLTGKNILNDLKISVYTEFQTILSKRDLQYMMHKSSYTAKKYDYHVILFKLELFHFILSTSS